MAGRKHIETKGETISAGTSLYSTATGQRSGLGDTTYVATVKFLRQRFCKGWESYLGFQKYAKTHFIE
jgi:hypothetical protein